jgi:hypothetical protein
MALNFPSNPVDGQFWSEPSNGIVYQFKVDPLSPTGQGKWTSRLGQGSQLDGTYLRLDTTNSPLLGSLDIQGQLGINEGTQGYFTFPTTLGAQGQVIVSAGDGTTFWSDVAGGAEVSNIPPTSPSEGDFWFNEDDGRLYVWYEDPSSSQWVDISGVGADGTQKVTYIDMVGDKGIGVQGGPISSTGTFIVRLNISSLGVLP